MRAACSRSFNFWECIELTLKLIIIYYLTIDRTPHSPAPPCRCEVYPLQSHSQGHRGTSRDIDIHPYNLTIYYSAVV